MISLPAQYVVNEKGNKTAVLLPLAIYEQLLEDLHDLAIVAQRREETPINLSQMLKRLGLENEL